MSSPSAIAFVENPVVAGRRDRYLDVTVNTAKIIESWRLSLHAFEWVAPDGRIKSCGELPAGEQPKRTEVEEKLRAGKALEKPVLGIGLLENVEIGSGRATFLTLAAAGVPTIPVHIPVSNKDEFSPFLS